MRFLRADGAEHEAELPFSGIHELLHPVLGLIDELPAPQAGALRGALAMSDEPVERFAVSAAVLGLLGAAAAEAPVLACIDDAQWIDSASLEALGFAARRIRRVALLVAFRDEVAASFRLSRFERLALGGLGETAIATLVAGSAERPLSSNLVTRVARATHGNPLAALEVAAAVSDDRLAGRIGLGEPLPPGRLISHAFERRLDELSDPARGALVLAAAGESENAHVIHDAAGRLGLPPGAFAEAERAGAIAAAEDRLRFRHPLLRSLVYDRAGAEQRRGAHAALAASLEAANGTAGERRAWHLAAATVAPDEAVAEALAAAAGRFAQRTGYLAAAYAYERAAELTPAPAQRAERLVAAAEASRLAGRPAHARELLADAAPLAQDVSLHDEIALKDAMLEAWLGSVAVAAERYAAIADEVTGRDPDRGAYALSLAAGTAIAAGDTGAALASARRAAALLPGVSESTACTVRETLGTVLVLRGEPGEGAPLLREAAAWFEREGELPGRDYVAQALLWVEDYELARRLLDPLLDHAGRVGDIRALTSALEVHAQLAFRTGHWREAHVAAAESVRLADRHRAHRPARLQPRRARDRRGRAGRPGCRDPRRRGRRDRRPQPPHRHRGVHGRRARARRARGRAARRGALAARGRRRARGADRPPAAGRPAVGGGPARGHGPRRAARGGARPARRAGAPGGGDLARLGRRGRGPDRRPARRRPPAPLRGGAAPPRDGDGAVRGRPHAVLLRPAAAPRRRPHRGARAAARRRRRLPARSAPRPGSRPPSASSERPASACAAGPSTRPRSSRPRNTRSPTSSPPAPPTRTSRPSSTSAPRPSRPT